jgi:hypothetical protein
MNLLLAGQWSESAMRNRRILCLLLLLIGGLSHGGYIAEELGTPFFFVGMGCFVIALVLFISSGSSAEAPASPQPLPVAEPELPPPLPTLRAAQREPIRRRADRVVEIDPQPIDDGESATDEIELTEVNDLQAIDGAELETDEIDLTEADDSQEKEDGEFQVTSDISLPVEIQDQLSLSDQLDRLKRLFDSGGLTEEEYHRAKSKLLA